MSCTMVLDDWVKYFICGLHPSVIKEQNIWSCIGTETFWQSGRKKLLKVLLILDMDWLIGDISPTSDVTNVAGLCNSYFVTLHLQKSKVKLIYQLCKSLHHCCNKRMAPTQLSVSAQTVACEVYSIESSSRSLV